MAMFEGQDLNDRTDRDWRAFTVSLADDLAILDPHDEVSVSPKFGSDTSEELSMLLNLTVEGTLVCVSTGLHSPPPPWRTSDRSGAHVLVDDEAWVDRFAASVVEQIRRNWNVPHPSFLVATGAISVQNAASDPTPRDEQPGWPAAETALAEAVARAVDELSNAKLHASSDGSYCITFGRASAYVYIASTDEIRVHAPIVERISGRTRAAEVVADLNRRHPRIKFLLVEDRVHAAISIDADPLVSRHAINAITRLARFAASVDDAFADNLGGAVASSGHVEAHSESEDVVDDDVPPQLMTLLEMDAESGGAVDSQDIVSVCGADRSKIARFEAFCSAQAASWRDHALEAAASGEQSSADECEAEALPWDRIVRALNEALRTVGFFDNA